MPTIAQSVAAVAPVGSTLAQYLASQNATNNATNTVNAGATAAASGLNTASQQAIAAQNAALATQQGIASTSQANTGAASTTAQSGVTSAANTATIAQQQALAQQQGIYNTTVQANAPYQATGLTGNTQLQNLIADPNSLTNTPGYQFEENQGLQAGQRAAAASGTLGNGGTIKAQTRYALDYANTKYNDAVSRLLQVTGVGQNANAANQAAGNTLGSQIGTAATNEGNIATGAATQNANIGTSAATQQNAAASTLGAQTGTAATNVGNIGTQNAENQASLTLAQAELAAKNQSAQGVNAAGAIGSIAGAIPGIVKAFTGAAAAPTIAGAAATAAAAPAIAAGAPAALASIPLATTALAPSTAAAISAATTAGVVPAGVASSAAAEAGSTAEALGTGSASSIGPAIGAFLTNPITIGVGAALLAGYAILKATQVHGTADDWTQHTQTQFGTNLTQAVQQFNQNLPNMTQAQAQSAVQQIKGLTDAYTAAGQQFAQKGSKQQTVINQSDAEMTKDFGPNFSKLLGDLQNQVNGVQATQGAA